MERDRDLEWAQNQESQDWVSLIRNPYSVKSCARNKVENGMRKRMSRMTESVFIITIFSEWEKREWQREEPTREREKRVYVYYNSFKIIHSYVCCCFCIRIWWVLSRKNSCVNTQFPYIKHICGNSLHLINFWVNYNLIKCDCN